MVKEGSRAARKSHLGVRTLLCNGIQGNPARHNPSCLKCMRQSIQPIYCRSIGCRSHRGWALGAYSQTWIGYAAQETCTTYHNAKIRCSHTIVHALLLRLHVQMDGRMQWIPAHCFTGVISSAGPSPLKRRETVKKSS